MKLWGRWGALVTVLLCVSACGSITLSLPGDEDDSEGGLDAEWSLASARGVQAEVNFESASGSLTITNNESAALASPKLFVFDLSTAERSSVTLTGESSIAAGTSEDYSFTYPGDAAPEDTALFGLQFGDDDFGRFFTAEDFAELPDSVTEGADLPDVLSASVSTAKAIGTPASGSYQFNLAGSTSHLTGANCPIAGGGFSSSGTASLNVACLGSSATLTIDNNVLQYHRMPSGIYQTPEYQFPVRDEDDNIVIGENYYDLTDSSGGNVLSGELHWDNSLGCTADYPYSLTQITSSATEILDICPGFWNITNLSAVTCGTNIIFSTPADYLPIGLTEVSTIDDPSTGEPIILNIDSSVNWLMPRSACTNLYGNMYAPMSFAAGIDHLGFPMTFTFSYQVTAITENFMMGVGVVQGISATNACTSAFFFNLEAQSPCAS